uniref:Disease resistance RPP13-like protein 1 n=1 Tax=Nelumbo nucifera TaxID=4432 RepID=A0A822ZKT3_NELNU|nr:TPA_asm: hypothetical protein HUJ06_003583 [Nelumbo nucifera]
MSNLTELKLIGCRSCKVISFPHLGKLKHLTIGDMDNWKGGEWSSASTSDTGGANINQDEVNDRDIRKLCYQPLFPHLSSLRIYKCPKLRTSSIPYHLPFLTSLWIENCEGLESLPQGMPRLFISLDWLRIVGCPRLMAFPKAGLPIKLNTFEISECGEGKRGLLPKGVALHRLTSLQRLIIMDSSGLKSFPKDDDWQLQILEKYLAGRRTPLPNSGFRNQRVSSSMTILRKE